MSLFSRDKSRLSFPVRVEDFLGREANEARSYGVLVRAVDVPPGKSYWRVLHVRHLSPEENRGGHYIYVDVLDEEGRRVPGAEVEIRWESGRKVERVQSRENRPGIRFPMDKWSLYDVSVAGLPSEQVIGLTASHPGEGRGNEPFRHSFLIVWQRVTRPAEETPPPSEEVSEQESAQGTEEIAAEAPPEPTPAEVLAATVGASVEATAEAVEAITEASEAAVSEETGAEAAEAEQVAEEETVPAAAPPTEESPSEAVASEAPAAPEPEPPEAETPEEEAPEEEAPREEAQQVEEAPGATPEAVPTTVAPLPIYVLFADGQDNRVLAAFFVVLEQLEKARVPFGFDTWDAARHARRVIVVGQPDEAKVQELQQAVDDVVVLEGESNTLKEQFEHALGVG